MTAVVPYISGATLGYYVMAAYLLSATIRPAAAYFAHLRERIRTLSRESSTPAKCGGPPAEGGRAGQDRHQPGRGTRSARRTQADDLRRTEDKLADGTAYTRQLLTAELTRLQDAQVADREAARQRDELGRRIEVMVRRIDATLTGLGDQQELRPACGPWSGWSGQSLPDQRRELGRPDRL